MQLTWRPVSLGSGIPISTSLTEKETAALTGLVRPGSRVLEIGSAFGYSAIALALAGAHVHAVDPHTWIPDSHNLMLHHIASYGVLDKITVRVTDSYTEMPVLHAAGELFDIVWIDGDHIESAVTHDVYWGRKLLNPTGTLVCHDYDEATCPGVRTSLDKWLPPVSLVDTMAIYGPGAW